uniref:Uncharacterized protein n=1 Tax=Oryza punctata TaxID=4537 RepID=A0A0E0M4L6_ORYPU
MQFLDRFRPARPEGSPGAPSSAAPPPVARTRTPQAALSRCPLAPTSFSRKGREVLGQLCSVRWSTTDVLCDPTATSSRPWASTWRVLCADSSGPVGGGYRALAVPEGREGDGSTWRIFLESGQAAEADSWPAHRRHSSADLLGRRLGKKGALSKIAV